MYYKGTRIYKLSDMIPGQIYLYAEVDGEAGFKKVDPTIENDLKDSVGNILYSFVFIEKKVWAKTEVEYVCDLIEAPDGQSQFKLFETLDQDSLDKGTSGLYKLGEV